MMFVSPVEPGRELLLECCDIRDAPGETLPGRAEVPEAYNEALWPTAIDRNRPASVLRRRDESYGNCGATGVWPLAQQ
jgi:hypothetical protein